MSFLSIIKNDLDRDRPAVKRWINIDSKRQINASITHFIYELIQNADDSQSSFVTITLEKDRLIFLNNGDCFNESNTRSLVSLGYSDKDE
jgi:hypothetical protein